MRKCVKSWGIDALFKIYAVKSSDFMFLAVSLHCAIWISSQLQCVGEIRLYIFLKKIFLASPCSHLFSWWHRDLIWPWEHYHQDWNDWWGLVAWCRSRWTFRDVPCQLRGAHSIASLSQRKNASNIWKEELDPIWFFKVKLAYKSDVPLLCSLVTGAASTAAWWTRTLPFAFFLFSITGVYSGR